MEWCKTCENKYGSVPCLNCCSQKTWNDHIIIYHSPSNYVGKDKDKRIIEVNTKDV